ncbi:hypothetical protein HWV62_18676 [Athelia sp. TMB]|nr:hypothetical protein HWV62_18676 [Athelia sp. TMB]
MFIALIGPRSSGKNTIKQYLLNKGFTALALEPNGVDQWYANDQPPHSAQNEKSLPETDSAGTLVFPSPPALLDYITTRWAANFVTTALNTRDLVGLCSRRPAFLLVRVDSPLGVRFARSGGKANADLESFIEEDDRIEFGSGLSGGRKAEEKGLRALRRVVHVHISNVYATTAELYTHMDAINLLDPERLRPGWDTYFMVIIRYCPSAALSIR